MIDGEQEGFNPTKSEQEMPYRTYGPVLGTAPFYGVFS